MGAVTTVSGTGSEMNSGAVITNTETNQKNGLAGIDALAAFIKEIGLPTTLTELKAGMRPGSPDPTNKEILRKVADSTLIMPGCARQMSHEEIYDILVECV